MKTHLKRSLIFGLMVLVSLSLYGCGEDKKENSKEEPVYYLAISKDGKEIRYRESTYVDYETYEKDMNIVGAFDLEEGVFSYIQEGKKHLAQLTKDHRVKDEETGLDALFKVEEGRVLVEPESFLTHFGYTIEKEAVEKKEEEDREASEASEKRSDSQSEEQGKEEKASLKESEESVNLEKQEEDLKGTRKKLLMAWDNYVNNSTIKFDKSLDVLIAKSIVLTASNGDVGFLLGDEYIENVKSQYIDLWIMATNAFNPDLSKEFLNSYSARKNYIDSLVNYCLEKKIDGISIDFENMYLEDSDLFVQFIAELNLELTKHNIVLGVCVTVPGGSDMWSKVYDRKRIAEHADYLMLMAYDQHWAASQISGPVASYTWVKQNIEELSKIIDKDKIILGVPLYTRVWYETYSTEIANKVDVRSKDFYMVGPKNILDRLEEAKVNYKRVWDAEASQYFFVYYESGSNEIIKFWYDDADAVARKANLVNELNLPGISMWALGFESPEIWKKLDKVKKNTYYKN